MARQNSNSPYIAFDAGLKLFWSRLFCEAQLAVVLGEQRLDWMRRTELEQREGN